MTVARKIRRASGRLLLSLALTTLIGCAGHWRPSDTVIEARPASVAGMAGMADGKSTTLPGTLEPRPEAIAAAPPAPAVIPPTLRLYGFFKPTVILPSGAVESYGQPNASGITNAGNPVYSVLPDRSRLSFQMAQSRLGLWIGENRPLKGQVELDFVDVTKASPISSLPRLRIAKLEWRVADNLTLLAGQDWQLYQPVNPHGADYIGALMEAGNSAFVRQQVRALWNVGSIELGGEVGTQNFNSLSKDAATELSVTPTFALRAQYNLDGPSKLGVDGIATSVLYNAGTPNEARSFAGGAGLYGDLTLAKIFNLRFEGYIGQNTANIFLLTLAQGRPGTDLQDAGGFVSAKVAVADRLSLYGRFGGAAVLHPTDVVPAYAYGTTAVDSPPALSSAALAGTGPGIKSNLTGSLGADVKLFGGLSLLVEGFWYRTRFALMDVDVGRVSSVSRVVGTEFALLWLL